MNNLSINKILDKKESKMTYFLWFVYCCYFLLNFLGSPKTIYLYYLTILVSLFIVLTKKLNYSIVALLMFHFIEGQGRILMGYHPISRIIFDLLVSIAILKNFSITKKFFPYKQLPKSQAIFIILHFLWWALVLFNTIGAGPLLAFSSGKYFILPFFFYAHLSYSNISLFSSELQTILKTLFLMIFLTTTLSIFQKYMGEDLMYSISENYRSLNPKFSVFTGKFFRPWGTSFLPGAIAPFLYTSFFIVFFSRIGDKFIKKYLILILSILLTAITIFFSGVRSSILAFTLIISASLFIDQFIQDNRPKSIVKILVLGTLTIIPIYSYVFTNNLITENLDIDVASERLFSLFDKSQLFSSRQGPVFAFNYLLDYLVFPFGVGPGMLQASLPGFLEQRRLNPHIHQGSYWALDNGYIFPMFELGVGGIFYILSFLILFIVFFRWGIKFFRNKQYDYSKIFFLTSSYILISVIMNWGANLFPFNPFSFNFWLLIGISLSIYNNSKDQHHEPQ